MSEPTGHPEASSDPQSELASLSRGLGGHLRREILLGRQRVARATVPERPSATSRFGELAPRRPAEIVIHDVTSGTAENWAVDSFGASAVSGELTANVRSFAPDAQTKTLTLLHNGNEVAEQTVEIDAGGRAQATFAALDLAEGSNRVEVALTPADDLSADDRRYLAVKRPEPREVLIVAPDVEGRAALFTSAALETPTPTSSAP